MNILVAAESMRVNTTSSGIVSSTFIKMLHESGFCVKVITQNDFDYPIDWLPEGVSFRKFNISKSKKRWWQKIPKVRALPTYLTGINVHFRDLINQYKSEIQKELVEKEYDCIYALGSGASFAPHFALSEMALEIPYFVNIHDPFPMHLYPEPYKKPKNRINYLLEQKFNKVLEKSKGISFPSLYLMQSMESAFPCIQQKGFVVPHIGTNLRNLKKTIEDNSITLGKGKINILHAGTLLGPRNPKYIIKALLVLGKEYPELMDGVEITFLGGIAKELKDEAKKVASTYLRFLDQRVSYARSLELIQEADAMMVVEAISDFSPFLPGKVADIAFYEKTMLVFSPEKSEVLRVLGTDYLYQSRLDDVAGIKQAFYNMIVAIRENKVSSDAIQACRKYVSIAENGNILKQKLN